MGASQGALDAPMMSPILAITMILRGGGVVSGRVWGWRGWSRSKETNDFHKINLYLSTMNVNINF